VHRVTTREVGALILAAGVAVWIPPDENAQGNFEVDQFRGWGQKKKSRQEQIKKRFLLRKKAIPFSWKGGTTEGMGGPAKQSRGRKTAMEKGVSFRAKWLRKYRVSGISCKTGPLSWNEFR